MCKSKIKCKFKILNITGLNHIIAGSRHWNFTAVKLSIPAPYQFYFIMNLNLNLSRGKVIWFGFLLKPYISFSRDSCSFLKHDSNQQLVIRISL